MGSACDVTPSIGQGGHVLQLSRGGTDQGGQGVVGVERLGTPGN